MTKLISVLVLAGLLYGGWHFFLYWERVQAEETQRKETASEAVNPSSLPGLPPALETSLHEAQQRGAQALKAWLDAHGPALQDPRKGWIELDYAMLLSRGQPAEARRIFAAVKARTLETSPVYSRIKQLEKTYE